MINPIFYLVGPLLKLGHKVDILENNTVFNQVHTNDEYGTDRFAILSLTEQYASTPVGIWLSTRQYYFAVSRVLKWPNANIMDWYQSPYSHFVISSVNFYSIDDAVQFKLTWL